MGESPSKQLKTQMNEALHISTLSAKSNQGQTRAATVNIISDDEDFEIQEIDTSSLTKQVKESFVLPKSKTCSSSIEAPNSTSSRRLNLLPFTMSANAESSRMTSDESTVEVGSNEEVVEDVAVNSREALLKTEILRTEYDNHAEQLFATQCNSSTSGGNVPQVESETPDAAFRMSGSGESNLQSFSTAETFKVEQSRDATKSSFDKSSHSLSVVGVKSVVSQSETDGLPVRIQVLQLTEF